MNYSIHLFLLSLLVFLISGVFADPVCDVNTNGCTCDTSDTVGGLKCGYELNNHCPTDPGSIFQCNPIDKSICRFVGGCLFGCCATGDGRSKCCDDSTCTGCPSGDFHPNLPAVSTGTTTFQTPDVLSISYIKGGAKFSTDCENELAQFCQEVTCGPACAFLFSLASSARCNLACIALSKSANPDPPNYFSNMNGNGGDFDKWAGSKEYRGYIHIPSFSVSCNTSGHLVNFNPQDPDYRDKHNPTQQSDQVVDAERNPYGYTKTYGYTEAYVFMKSLFEPLGIKVPPGFDPADIYTQDQSFNGINWSQINGNTCLKVHDARSSRLASFERVVQYPLLGYDAPFVYTQIDMKVCCDRTVSIQLSRSVFPETLLYINGQKVGEQAETNLGDFVKYGGVPKYPFVLNSGGHGSLAPPGQGLTWNGKV